MLNLLPPWGQVSYGVVGGGGGRGSTINSHTVKLPSLGLPGMYTLHHQGCRLLCGSQAQILLIRCHSCNPGLKPLGFETISSKCSLHYEVSWPRGPRVESSFQNKGISRGFTTKHVVSKLGTKTHKIRHLGTEVKPQNIAGYGSKMLPTQWIQTCWQDLLGDVYFAANDAKYAILVL